MVIKDPLSEKDLDLPVQSPGLVIGGAPSTSPKSFLRIDIIILQLNKCTNLAFIKISSLVETNVKKLFVLEALNVYEIGEGDFHCVPN